MEDKWSLLYDYSRKAFDDEISRFARLDEKAVKFITSTSIIITIFVALSKWLFSENNNYFTVYVYMVTGLIFIFLCMAWTYYFFSLRLTVVPKMPVTDEIFDLFKNKNISTIHVTLYKSAKTATEELSSTIHKKAKYIVLGFRCTSTAGLLLILFIGMVILESNNTQNIFCKTKLNTQHEKVTTMCEGNTPQDNNSTNNQQSDNEPDLNVTAPELEYSAENFNGSSTHNQQTDNEPDLDVIAPNLQYSTEGFDSTLDDDSQTLNESTNDEK